MADQNNISSLSGKSVGFEAFYKFYLNMSSIIRDATLPPASTMYTLDKTKWTGDSAPYKYELTVQGATPTNVIIVSPANSITDQVFDNEYDTNVKAEIRRVVQSENKLTFVSYGIKPTIDLHFDIAII